MNNLIWEIKLRFEKALEEKTSWGRNDLKKLYDDIVIETLSEHVSKASN
jgi:hypothetical protein